MINTTNVDRICQTGVKNVYVCVHDVQYLSYGHNDQPSRSNMYLPERNIS